MRPFHYNLALPVTRFLFWNVNRKPLESIITHVANEHDVDVVVLAEYAGDVATMLRSLNARGRLTFHYPDSLCASIRVFTGFSRRFIKATFESDRVSIRRLRLPARAEILIAMVHLPSKLHWSSESQAFEGADLALRIAAEEDRAGHQRTVLLGDFNMNPFESGIVAAGGLNSVMSRTIAARLVRTVQGREYRFFYNPMWAHLGDLRRSTSGSYFYDSAEHVNFYWNVFDQVLVRPQLAERFDCHQLKILTSAGGHSLVKADGRPNGTVFSDHLPILVALEF